MSVFSPRESTLHPLIQMILLLAMVIVMGGLFTMIGAWIATKAYAIPDFQDFVSSMEEQAKYPGAMIIVQAFGIVGSFFLPAVAFSLSQGQAPMRYFQLNMPLVGAIAGLAVLVMLFSQPVITATGLLNEQVQIPDSWGGLKQWLDDTNYEVQQGYDALLNIDSLPKLMTILLVVGVLPAIGEELIFRGGFQQILHTWTKNGHLAVWLAAIIFSLFHFQFYYFLPRLLLGAAIGYLFMWSGNLWYAIIAHFFNNAWVVVIAYFYLQQGQTVEDLQKTEAVSPGWLIAGSLLFLGILLVYRFVAVKHKPHLDAGELDQDIHDYGAP